MRFSSPDARCVVFDDGAVVFDPLTWQTRTVFPDALQILEWIGELIASGVGSRDALLDALLAERGNDLGPYGASVEQDDAVARDNLGAWVDLALNLCA